MKKTRTIVSGLLCATLLFTTACSASSNSDASNVSTKKGRYIQTDVTPENFEGTYSSKILKDASGNFIFFSGDFTKKFTSTDNGETWQESEGIDTKNADANSSIMDISIDNDGNIYTLSYSFSEEDDNYSSTYSFNKILEDGTSEKIDIPEITKLEETQNTEIQLSSAQILPNGEALISYYSYDNTPAEETTEESDDSFISPVGVSGGEVSGIYNVSTGEKVLDITAEVPSWDGYTFTTNKDTLLLGSYDGNATKVSLTDHTITGTLPLPTTENSYLSNFSLTDDGTLYALSNTAIYKITSDKTETVMDASAFAFGNTSSSTTSFYALPDDIFLASVQGAEKTSIFKYAYDPNATMDPNKVLTIWSLNDDYNLRSLISEFSQANPDATITYTPAISYENITYSDTGAVLDTGADDAIKALNTELLSGKGPDIIILDGLSASSYAEKGTLLDLSEKLDTSNVFPQVLDAFKDGDKLYSIPTRFTVPLLVGDAGSLTNMSTVADIATAVKNGPDSVTYDADSQDDPFASIAKDKRPILQFDDFSELFDTLWTPSANAILVDNKLQEDAMRTFLTDLKTISDKYKLASSTDGSEGYSSYSVMDSYGSSYYGSSMAFMSKRAQYGALNYDNISALQMFGTEETVDLDFIGFPGLSSGVWKPSGVLAVNANSKSTDFAVQFISTSIAVSAQSVLGNGLPITQEAIDAQIKKINELMKKYSEMEGTVQTFSFDFTKITSIIKTPYFNDAQIFSKVSAAAYEYCKGTNDLDQTINKIKEDFRSYLAERE